MLAYFLSSVSTNKVAPKHWYFWIATSNVYWKNNYSWPAHVNYRCTEKSVCQYFELAWRMPLSSAKFQTEKLMFWCFPTFPVDFYIPIIFSDLNSNCSDSDVHCTIRSENSPGTIFSHRRSEQFCKQNTTFNLFNFAWEFWPEFWRRFVVLEVF